jgi:hypothetical protein
MYSSKAWLAGLLAAGLLAGVAGPALGHGPQERSGMHEGYGMGQDLMMGPGMGHGGTMRPGMHGRPGYGSGCGQGMSYGMHHGMSYGMHHGHGMHQPMDPAKHPGYGMTMGPGAGVGPGMIYGWPAGGGTNISVEDARGWLERRLAWHGNPRLKLVTEADDGSLVAEIVTRDGSLVQKLAIDRRSGALRQLDD